MAGPRSRPPTEAPTTAPAPPAAGTTGWQQLTTLSLKEKGIAVSGEAVALSADGNTALLGLPSYDDHQGSVWQFGRTATGWTVQAQFSAPHPADNQYFGASLALSADGSTTLIGAWGKDADGAWGTGTGGAAYIFTRNGSSWVLRRTYSITRGAAVPG
jgi:hypothetical protein